MDLNQGDLLRIDFEKGRVESRVTRYTNPMPAGEAPIFLRTGPDGKEIVYIDRTGLAFVSKIPVDDLPAVGSGRAKPAFIPVAPKPAGR